jgi:predicted metalloprotease with PDZ domain
VPPEYKFIERDIGNEDPYQGGEGTDYASRTMKKKSLLGVCAVFLAGVLAFGLAPAPARSSPITVVVSGGDSEKVNECCTYLGIFMDELTARMKEKAGYTHEKGVMITSVSPGRPAEKAGIEDGDICYLFDGAKVEDPVQLAKLVRAHKAGDKVAIVVYRDGKEQKLFAKLETRAPLPTLNDELGAYSVQDLSKLLGSASKSASRLYMQSLARGHLGMLLADLNDDLAPYFGVKKEEGVLVIDTEWDSPAAKAGIKAGDVIVKVDGTAISTIADITDELSDVEKGDTVSLDVLRKGAKKSFTVKADEALGMSRILVAPFEPSGIKVEKTPSSSVWLEKGTKDDEARKLKQEMKALQERLKDLEDRLGKIEKEK